MFMRKLNKLNSYMKNITIKNLKFTSFIKLKFYIELKTLLEKILYEIYNIFNNFYILKYCE